MPTMNDENTRDIELKKSQRLLLGHGALVLLFGFIMGFGFLFFLIGKIALWPIPGSIDIQLPGTYDAWRMAHMEGISNGALLWILAVALPSLKGFIEKPRRIAIAMIIVAWTIVIASALDPLFPNARGLELTSTSSLANNIAFFLFYIGIVTATGVLIVIAKEAFSKS